MRTPPQFHKPATGREPAASASLAHTAAARARAQGALQRQVDDSPRVVAQRRQLEAAFGPAIQREAAPDEEALQMKPSSEVAQRAVGSDEQAPLQARALDAAAASGPAPAEAAPPNRTGMPDPLKAGIESLSGMSMDHVRVHYNSAQPAQFHALAYAQGSDIHLAPGQEQHLPHEAWHVVQQVQGRVRPTMQAKEGVAVNDDAGLEHEADEMGSKALQRLSPAPGARGSLPWGGPSSLQWVSASRSSDDRRARAGTATQPAAPSGGGVVQRVGFAPDTTYGMEIEFVNRWLTPLPLGKAAPKLSLDRGAAFDQPAPSPKMKVTGDDGRGGTTVLEIESDIFGRADFAQDRVQAEVDVMLAHAPEIVAHYRSRQPALLQRERTLVSQALGRPVQGDVLAQARTLAQDLATAQQRYAELIPHYERAKAAAEAAMDQGETEAIIDAHVADLEPWVRRLEEALWGRTAPRRLIFDRCSDIDEALPSRSNLTRALDAISARQAEAPMATLQVTTLALKGAQHAQALSETSKEVSHLNRASQHDGFETANALHGTAEDEVERLLTELAPNPADDGPAGLQLREDFRVTLECAVKMVTFAEADMLAASGTMKNLSYALPRRVIAPPSGGFAKALRIDPVRYESCVKALATRLSRTDSKGDSSALDVLRMLRRGIDVAADKKYEQREAQWRAEAAKSEGKLDPRYSLWTVEGGVPTLEADIIRAAKKDEPEKWTAHELRNFGWAMGLSREELEGYLALLKRRATEG
jgi:hypothetical protein